MASLAHHHLASPIVQPGFLLRLLPGIGLCLAVTGVAYAMEAAEYALVGKAWLEALVIAIVIGAALRSFWTPGTRWHAGIVFSAKYLLEVAVVLLGASVSTGIILAAGAPLLIGIAGVVATSILVSFGIGRLLGLPVRMALLIACGNSICGNSAIAAVAPVINADSDDVAASIAFTAVLGVVVVFVLPLFGLVLGLSGVAFGTLAGLTVYAVPQVIAAASPVGPLAVQMGMLVKLVRVLMLGPVCLVLSLAVPRLALGVPPKDEFVSDAPTARRINIAHLVPWFIVGFSALLICRSLGLVPTAAIAPIGRIATLLTVVSMAALGLGVDIRTVARAGGRVTAAVVLSLLALTGISLTLLATLHIP
ncbi:MULTISPECIES: YeiH family protein [Acetobacter]|uniref:Putative sulfate exporter family transporter n=1 Tax=Acetobacter oryzoeni TaxID=2500548 RepID=A0A5B9GT88_9PROT|nr:putative sulfate exporter family transporter [Acetobacter oryzoeni]MCP1203618.1 putative sulfate exporter family transporter [Acetobacter oryzoeni]QEE86745.1 putative sulfate exporter family transporter [Acetobacter oryzoeni]